MSFIVYSKRFLLMRFINFFINFFSTFLLSEYTRAILSTCYFQLDLKEMCIYSLYKISTNSFFY